MKKKAQAAPEYVEKVVRFQKRALDFLKAEAEATGTPVCVRLRMPILTRRRSVMVKAAILVLLVAYPAFAADLDQRMDRLEGRMGALEQRMDRLEGRMGALEGRMEALDNKIDGLALSLNARMDQIFLLGAGVIIGLIGLILWDRRSALYPLERRIEALERKAEAK